MGATEKKNINVQQDGMLGIPYMQNRELSWLRFNDRVLSEAVDDTVPLLERLRFVTIFTTNLDEFFRVRVGSLNDLMILKKNYKDNKSGMTAKEQLNAIFKEVHVLNERRDIIYSGVESLLRSHGICRLSFEELSGDEKSYVQDYFQKSVMPLLSPQIVDAHHPFPHLVNKVIHIGMVLKNRDGAKLYAFLPVPEALPEVIYIPGNHVHYIAMEDIVYTMADALFETYTVEEKVQMAITRNADIQPEDEEMDIENNFRSVMKQMLIERRRLAPVRLELSHEISPEILDYLLKQFSLTEKQVYITKAPIRMGYAYPLEDKLDPELRKALTNPPFTPQYPAAVKRKKPIWEQLQKEDILLSYPYQSIDPFFKMLSEAANDPTVISIKITIYRLAKKSKLVKTLCAAAENGKDVTVLIELRARFDEQNNIDWSQKLERAGCNIIYGVPNYKVHSKVCLITRHDENGVHYTTQIGTGNYNEKTSKLYTDLSLMTANQEIGQDAKTFFQNMGIGNLYGQYKKLMVAPVSLKQPIIELIDREIAKGSEGKLFFKINSLTDRNMIEKLKEASQAGVEVKMLIRGICCLLPGIPGVTENIEVRSIVGRYLEHSRIYRFGTGEDEIIYIASADLMTRNMERRVEVACPIYSPQIKERIYEIIDILWRDTKKARVMQSNGTYKKIKGEPFSAQAEQMNLAIEMSEETQKLKKAEKSKAKEEKIEPPEESDAKTAEEPKKGGFFAKIFNK